MLSEKTDQKLRDRLRADLSHARRTTDALFRLISDKGMYERPISERHRIIFYLGHLEAFDWNMIAQFAFGSQSFNTAFDKLFAFGIDPVDGRLPQDTAKDWPSIDEVLAYNTRVRRTIDRLLEEAIFHSSQPLKDGLIFHVAIEHRLMHAETLSYMFNFLPYELKVANSLALPESTSIAQNRQVDIPAGQATLGLKRESSQFGWDNEFEQLIIDVPAFSIDVHSVTNREFLRFAKEGGYQERSLWTPEAWEWISAEGITHPKFWMPRGEGFSLRTMFVEVPLPLDWPVYVSHAEASAYARWLGKALPSEAQYHRAAFGTAGSVERLYPWGDAEPRAEFGNFDFRQWTPSAIGSFPAGDSAFGIADLMGNGWEWTSTVFEPFPGFKPFSFYPGYSANFFDGNHFVLKGGSFRTSRLLLRRSFRNWFQPHYPNIYGKFRCVEN